jgi:hypothetical protein
LWVACYAWHKLGDDHRQAVEGGHLMHADDVRMPQLGCRAGYTLETLQFFLLGEQSGVGYLQGHDAVQFTVARLPPGPEAAQTKPLQELELAHLLHAGRRVGILRLAQPERTAAAGAQDLVGFLG